jgi:hypothetical protein
MGQSRMRFLNKSLSRITSMLALVALLTSGFVGLGDVKSASAGTVTTDSYGTLNLPYSYSGTVTNTDCANPARGAGYYGDFFRVSSTATTRLYMQTGWDSYIQVLDSNKTSIITQDDDSGTGVDAYINSVTVNSAQYIVASTYSPGATGSYTFHSDVPLTQVTNCPQVITVSAPGSIQYGSTGSMSASTNMSQPVTVTSQTSSICSVTSSAPNFTINALSPGTCTLVSSQAGNGSIEAAGNVTTNITITAKPLTISGLNGNKNYDGNTSVTFTGTASPAGVVGADAVSFSGTPTGTYNTPNAGTNTITVSGLTLSGAQASKYTLTNTISGVINKINQTLTWAPSTARNTTSTGTAFTAATTTSGGGAISYSVVNAGTTGCTVSGTTLNHTTSGTCVVRATAASNTNYNVATQDVSFVVSKVDQLVTWNPVTSLLAVPSSSTMLAASTNGNGALSYSISNAGTTGCTVSGTTLSYTGAGTCQVTATAAATNYYNVASTTVSFTISKATQGALTITAANAPMTFNASPLATTTLSASGGNGLGIMMYSVAAESAAVCSVSGNTVTALTAGTCAIQAIKLGDNAYLDRAGTLSITINKGTQAPIVLVPGESSFNYNPVTPATTTFTTSGGSGEGSISYAVASSSVNICSLSGNTITALSAGNCVIEATKLGDINYLDRFDSLTVQINRILQAGFALSAADSVLDYQAGTPATTTISTTGGSGTGAVSYLVQVGSNSVCEISGNTVSMLSAGDCVITATKADDENYQAVTDSITIVVNKIAQTAFELTAVDSSLTYQSSPAATTTLTASGGNGSGATSFAVDEASASVCSISGFTVTARTAGDCIVSATKSSDTNYLVASATTTINIAQATQTALTASATNSSLDYRATPAATTTLSTTGGSGTGLVTFEVQADSSSVCSVNGTTLTALTAGQCEITATKAADLNYLATSAPLTVIVNKIAQTAFELAATETTLNYSASPLATTTVSVSGGDGTGASTISVAQGSESVCSLSGSVVTALNAGSCVLEATKATDTNYLQATDTLTISIAKATQSQLVISATRTAISITGGANTSTLSFTGGTGTGAASWSIDPSSNGTCSLAGNTVTAVAVGDCFVVITKASDTNYESATRTLRISVAAALQAAVTLVSSVTDLTIDAEELTTATVTFSGGSGPGLVSFESLTPSLCVVGSGRNVTGGIEATVVALHAGTCQVKAIKAGDGNYAPAEANAISIVVAKGVQSALVVSLESSLTYSASPLASSRLIASGGNGAGSVSYTLVSGACTLTANELVANSAGDCVVRAIKASDQDFLEKTIDTTFTVAKANQALLSLDLAANAPDTIAWDGKRITNLDVAGGSGNGAITVATNSAEICTATIVAQSVRVTGVAAGSCEVTVTKASDTNYLARTASLDITVIDLPSAPTSVQIVNTGVMTDDGTAVTISWTAEGSTGTQAEVTGYEVQYKSGLNWITADGGLVDADVRSITVYPTPWTALFIRVAPVSSFDDDVIQRTNWTNYTGTSGGTAPVAFNIAGTLENISSPMVAASSGEVVFLTGTDFDQSTTNKVQITTGGNVFASGIGRAAVSNTTQVNAVVISPTRLSFVMPKVKLPTGQTQLASTVQVLSVSGVLSEAVSFNFIPKKLAQTVAVSGLPSGNRLVVGTAINGTLAPLGAIPTVAATAGICSAAINENGAVAITPIAKGACTVTISAPATPGYTAAAPKVFKYTVAGQSHAVTFADPADRAWSAAPMNLTATSDRNLPVVFTTDTSAICSVSGSTLTMLKAGVCTVRASSVGTSSIEAALPITQSFTISKANRTTGFAVTTNSVAEDGTETPVTLDGASLTASVANVSVAIGLDPVDVPVTLSARQGTVLFTVAPADDSAGRCVADPGVEDSLEGVITLTNLGSCKVTITQPADDRFNAGESVVVWVNAVALTGEPEEPEQDRGDGEAAEEDTDINVADPDSEPAVAINLPSAGGTFDFGGQLGLRYDPVKGLLTMNTRTMFVGTFKVVMTSPDVSKKWFRVQTVVKKKKVMVDSNTCTLTLTVKKDAKLKKSVLRTIGAGCTLSVSGKAALTESTIQKIKIAYVFNRAYAKTGLNHQGTSRNKVRVLAKVKRTLVLKVGSAN